MYGVKRFRGFGWGEAFGGWRPGAECVARLSERLPLGTEWGGAKARGGVHSSFGVWK